MNKAGYTFTAVIAALAVLSPVFGNMNITSPPVTDWGIWGRMQYCPPGRYAQGFQLKTESNQLLGDDTALNAIRLFCGDPSRQDTAVITSTEGIFGSWGKNYSCYPGFLTGFQLRVEGVGIADDDTATNNIRLFCSNPPTQVEFIEGDGTSWGDWTEQRHCHSRQAICGIQTQVEPYQESGDDTMLNNVRMECCNLPRSKFLTNKF